HLLRRGLVRFAGLDRPNHRQARPERVVGGPAGLPAFAAVPCKAATAEGHAARRRRGREQVDFSRRRPWCIPRSDDLLRGEDSDDMVTLRAERLQRGFGAGTLRTLAVRDVSLELSRGEITV